jgi:hypothetical protein
MRHSLWAAALAAAMLPCEVRAADKEEVKQAIDTGVRALRALQKPDGSWEYPFPGATPGSTSLAGLALLECGAARDDPAVVAAAKYVRAASLGLRYTYSISLVVLFLDRLGDPADEALLESLAARLIAGQRETGNWPYECPEPAVQEQQRLGELVARRRLPDAPRTEPAKSGDVARSFQQRVQLLNRPDLVQGRSVLGRPDNSVTQFAVLALWVSRRHGFPVDDALRSSDRHFRRTRNADGGWSYGDLVNTPRASTATMTCAGLLGLTVGYGVLADNPKGKPVRALSDDPILQAGLTYMATVVRKPLEKRSDLRSPRERRKGGARRGAAPSVGGMSYYLLWSLERVAVALNLETIGNKDWYDWGAEIVVTNQNDDGTWSGAYQAGGVDTSFALLFLKKANLVKDLSKLTGHVKDPGERALRVGGGGGDALGVGLKDGDEARPTPAPGRVATRPKSPEAKAPAPDDSPGDKLAAALVTMSADRQAAEIERLRDQKGAEHTEALAAAIPLLAPESRRKARSALAEREARMKLETIGRDLHDENAEIRAAAAAACALKETRNKEARQFVPQLIELLSDREAVVSRAAHASLRELSGVDFGPGAAAGEADRKKAAEQWQAWWKKQSH